MKLLSGTSNCELSKDIAHNLSIPLGNVEITRFIDNECRVYIKDDLKGQTVGIIQSLSEVADQHLVELCLLGQASKSLGALHVAAIIPWMGYSKQDKEFRRGEAVSAHLVAKFIESAGFDRVITLELHSEKITPYFRIPIIELSTHKLLGKEIAQSALSVVVSPDQGGKSRSDRFAQNIGLPVVHLTKIRDRTTGSVVISGIDGDVKNKDVVIFDDIINTGSTAIKTSEFLKSKGATSITFLATHAVLAGNAAGKLQNSMIDQIFVTDTIEILKQKMFPKLSIVSVADLITDAIRNEYL